ncbi:hypothetical protein [Deinococcus planocerae]|uniref:hypothetical protein n=1 Tax=Deinococcus planocerae TaxID=1737569 RepID=UPI0011AF86CE|nr:hypothetical protein [Deinococcus planocerae]
MGRPPVPEEARIVTPGDREPMAPVTLREMGTTPGLGPATDPHGAGVRGARPAGGPGGGLPTRTPGACA